MLVTYLLYSSSWNETRLIFKVETIVLRLKPLFCQSPNPTTVPVVLRGQKFLHDSFHFYSVVGVSWAQERNHRSKQVIIRWGDFLTICWVLQQLDSLKFLEPIPGLSNRSRFLRCPVAEALAFLTNAGYFCHKIAYSRYNYSEYRMALWFDRPKRTCS